MPADDFPKLISPAEFPGNFGAYVEQVQRELERHYGDDAGLHPNVVERAQSEAPYIAAREWLTERWSEHYPCPVCRNVEWFVGDIAPESRYRGFLSFNVICGYCGNSMQVVPGFATLDEPRLPAQEELPIPRAEP